MPFANLMQDYEEVGRAGDYVQGDLHFLIKSDRKGRVDPSSGDCFGRTTQLYGDIITRYAMVMLVIC